MSSATNGTAGASAVPVIPTSTGALAASPKITPRKWYDRGHAEYPNFLKTFHTFSFSMYVDYDHMGFSDLRVINEDRVEPRSGFPTHPHANAEIFSYIVSGELTHKDSMGNVETLKRGDLQFTRAGSGIRHSEYNDHKSKEVHFAQIWYISDGKNLKPEYYTSHTPDEMKRDVLKTLIKPAKSFANGEEKVTGSLPSGRPIPATNSLVTRASILSPGKSVTHVVGTDTDVVDQQGQERYLYLHVLQTTGYKDPEEMKGKLLDNEASLVLKSGLGETKFGEGDGAYIRGVKVGENVEFTNDSGKDVEFLLFDLRAKE